MTLKYNVKVSGGTLKDRQKCIRALDLMVQAANHPEFDKRVLAHKYNGNMGFANCTLTNQEVLDIIKSGKETLQPVVDNEIDFDWKLYSKRFTSVIGYTNPSITYINSNVLKLRQMSLAECAGHPFHEWLHKLGFDHDFEATKRRPYSVPYAVGYILEDVANLILKDQQQEEIQCHKQNPIQCKNSRKSSRKKASRLPKKARKQSMKRSKSGR